MISDFDIIPLLRRTGIVDRGEVAAAIKCRIINMGQGGREGNADYISVVKCIRANPGDTIFKNNIFDVNRVRKNHRITPRSVSDLTGASNGQGSGIVNTPSCIVTARRNGIALVSLLECSIAAVNIDLFPLRRSACVVDRGKIIAVLKCSVSDRCYTGRNGDGRKGIAVPEGILSNRGDTVRNHKTGQAGTAAECIFANGCNTARERDIGQAGAVAECTCSDGSYSVRNRDIDQTGTTTKCTEASACKTTRESDTGQAGTVGKDFAHEAAEAAQAFRQSDAGQAVAVHKCGVADAGQAVWQINASQADAVLKCHESDRLELGGIRNADKTGTAGERAHGNGSYVVRQGNAGQVGALSEAPLTDSGHTIGNGYRGDVGAEGKSKVADACYTAVDDDLLYVESVLEPRRIDAVFFCIVIVGTGEIGHRTGSADDQCAKTIQRPRQVSAAGAGGNRIRGIYNNGAGQRKLNGQSMACQINSVLIYGKGFTIGFVDIGGSKTVLSLLEIWCNKACRYPTR